jgi:hypothetical protein
MYVVCVCIHIYEGIKAERKETIMKEGRKEGEKGRKQQGKDTKTGRQDGSTEGNNGRTARRKEEKNE